MESDLDLMLLDLVYKRGVGLYEIFESDEAMTGEPEGTRSNEWAYSESILKRRYYRLSKIYHPDCNGSCQQMNNLIDAYNTARTFVLAKQGIGR